MITTAFDQFALTLASYIVLTNIYDTDEDNFSCLLGT